MCLCRGDYETIGSGHYCPCGFRKDDAFRSSAVPYRRDPEAGAGGSPDSFSGHPPDGTGSGHYDFAHQACIACEMRNIRCWILPDTWTFQQKPNALCRCWTMPFWSSAAQTACSPTRKPCGNCWNAIRCRCSSLSTKWTWQGQTRRQCWNSCKAG